MQLQGPKSSESGFKWLMTIVVTLLAIVVIYNLATKKAVDTPLGVNDFFAPDGSSYTLEKAIKKAMDDPDSYEHVETTHTIDGQKIFVSTKFRGNNKFGAKVLSEAQGILDKTDGHVIQWNMIK